MQMALKCMGEMKIDLGILTETKIVTDVHARSWDGYSLSATQADSTHQGGVALFYRTRSDAFVIEGTRTFGPNDTSNFDLRIQILDFDRSLHPPERD